MNRTAATPAVMGRAAVVTPALILGAVGLAQLVGIRVSGVIDDSSARYLGTVWGTSFILAAAFVVAARRTRDAYLAMVYENAGIICLVGGLIVYIITLFGKSGGWPTNGTVTLALAASAAINLTGRGLLLFGSICRWILVFRSDTRAAAIIRSFLRLYLRAVRSFMRAYLRVVSRR